MKIAVGTIEVDDETRMAINTVDGKPGKASRSATLEWLRSKLSIEIEGVIEVAAEIRRDAREARR